MCSFGKLAANQQINFFLFSDGRAWSNRIRVAGIAVWRF